MSLVNHQKTTSVPAILVAAAASNQGKTMVTAALARYHRNQGKVVRVMKAGPDFLDPMIHEQASGQPVDTLDLWMVGEPECRQRLFQAAEQADLLIIECGMGLYDGDPSSADLACLFGVPVLAIIDGSSMAQTFGAIAHGLSSYRPELPFAGVLANRVGSEYHAELLRGSVSEGMRYFGGIPRDERMTLPDRHLGLVQASEVNDLEARLNAAADVLEAAGVTELPDLVTFADVEVPTPEPLLQGKTIAIAKDGAFSFIYNANIELLVKMGAKVQFFSPLTDDAIPEADALWLPGGYPELHLKRLETNLSMLASMRAFHQSAKPMLAECGGMLYLLESLANKEGEIAQLAGVLAGKGLLQKKLAGLGMHSVHFPFGTLRGHAFHHSKMESAIEPSLVSERRHGKRVGEAIYQQGSLTATYVHFYFPSNPTATACLFGYQGDR